MVWKEEKISKAWNSIAQLWYKIHAHPYSDRMPDDYASNNNTIVGIELNTVCGGVYIAVWEVPANTMLEKDRQYHHNILESKPRKRFIGLFYLKYISLNSASLAEFNTHIVKLWQAEEIFQLFTHSNWSWFKWDKKLVVRIIIY